MILSWRRLSLLVSLFCHLATAQFCWVDGFTEDDCCNEERFGRGGNSVCWIEGSFSYERCCSPQFKYLEQMWGPKLLQILGGTEYEELEKNLRQSVNSPENRTTSTQTSYILLVLLLRLRQRFVEAEELGPLPSNLEFDEESGIWKGKESAGYHMHDLSLSKEIISLLHEEHIETLFDFGCGLGWYVRDFRKAGIKAGGVDGNPDTITLSDGRCTVADLSKDLRQGFQYDAVLSLEVAEHISAKREKEFVGNLDRHAKRLLIISWGNQAGYGHINNRDSNYVVQRIESITGEGNDSDTDSEVSNGSDARSHYYQYDEKSSIRLRNAASFGWFKETIHVFRKKKRTKN